MLGLFSIIKLFWDIIADVTGREKANEAARQSELKQCKELGIRTFEERMKRLDELQELREGKRKWEYD